MLSWLKLVQLLGLLLFVVASVKDIRDRAVWRGLGNLLVVTGLAALWTASPSNQTLVLLLGPAAAWLVEQFDLWTVFDSRAFVSLVYLNSLQISKLFLFLWPIYLSWATLWKRKWPETDLPVLPVFLVIHFSLFFL